MEKNRERKKKESGITLIALVVTIIVLLILAGVTINFILGQEGIFNKAQTAAEKTKTSSDLEILQLAVMESITQNEGKFEFEDFTTIDPDKNVLPEGFKVHHGSLINTSNKKEYKVDKDGNITIVDMEVQDPLEKFILGGEEKEGTLVANIIDSDFSIKEDLNNFVDTKEISITGYYFGDKVAHAFLLYKDKIYEVTSKEVDVVEVNGLFSYMTDSVEMVYQPKGDEGKKVAYSYDGAEQNKKDWTILYDDGDYIEILSPDALGGYTIGVNGDINSPNNIARTIDQYNDAPKLLNAECAKLVTNTNKVSVRSVGSNPKEPNAQNEKKYEDSRLGEYSGKISRADENIEKDLTRMSYYGNLYIPGEEYWLASRGAYEGISDSIVFYVNVASQQTTLDAYYLGGRDTEGMPYSNSNTFKVRPIVKVKKSEVTIK